eukprot:445210_1
MRVLYIHAGKRIKKELKADDYHVDLFHNKLRLKFEMPSHHNAMQNVFIDCSSSLDSIEKLPRGEILGIAIFNETYWFDRNLHSSDPWKLGPFCYGILDVFRFEKGVKACGQLGIWTPKQDAQNQIAQQISVQNKINEWKHTYGDQLYFGKDPNGIPAAITILQPFVEGILRGIKRVENRKAPFFRLHDNKLLYKHPIAPKQTKCRFCPSDKSKCVYWAHFSAGKAANKSSFPCIVLNDYNEKATYQVFDKLGISTTTYHALIYELEYSFSDIMLISSNANFSKDKMKNLYCSKQIEYFLRCYKEMETN